MRDNFTMKAKDALARRAGMRCSNPECRKPTSGPHKTQEKAVNIGVACHIAAASPGGPRYKNTITNEARKSIDNGIWLCQNCSKLIDSDEHHFTAEVLLEWKRIAEESARHDLEGGYSLPVSLPAIKVLLVTAEHPRIGKGFFEKFALNDLEIIRSVLLPSDKIDILLDASIVTLSKALMKGYDIIQFEAHVEHEGSLVLGTDTISPAALASVIGDRQVKCVLFMTCNSANVIGALHANNVPCVIAATGSLYADYSNEFCRAFYSSVSNGFSFHDAFAHANIVSSRTLEPFRDQRLAGNLSISIHKTSNVDLTLRSLASNRYGINKRF